VLHNQQRLLELQQEFPDQQMLQSNMHDKIVRITDLDFAFPQEYEPNTIRHQTKRLASLVKEKQQQITHEFDMKTFFELKPKALTFGELARILEKPNLLAEHKHSFLAFKRLSDINLPGFLKKRQNAQDELRTSL